MLKKMLVQVPLALALGLSVTAPPAVAQAAGDVQLMAGTEWLWFEHTIRHGDGSWDHFNHFSTGDRGFAQNLASASFNGEMGVVYDLPAQIKPSFRETFLSIRHADGSWTTEYTPFQVSGGPRAVANVAGSLHVVQRSGDTVRHSMRRADGSWTAITNVPVPQSSTSVAAVNTNGALEVLVVDGDSLMTTTLRADGTWSTAAPATSFSGQFQAATVDVARVGTDLQVVVNSTNGALYHAIRRSDGRWSRWGDVGAQTGVPGTADSVAVTASGATMHLAVTTAQDGVYHSIRFGNGAWQPFGNVLNIAGGTRSHDVALAGD